MKRTTMLLLGGLMLIMSLSGCYDRIKPGYTGFKLWFTGDDKGQTKYEKATGWVGYTPGVSTVIIFPTSMQHQVWTENSQEGSAANEEIVIACKGGAGFKCDVGFNYTVIPDSAAYIYFKYKTDDLSSITTTYLRNTVRMAMQQVSGTITLDSMLNNIPAYERAVDTVLAQDLAPQGFKLEQFTLLAAPRPTDPNIQKAINSKITEKQLAEQALMTRTKEENLALAKAATARGDSAQLVIVAAGQAEAIKKLQTQITPVYNDYLRAKAYKGDVPSQLILTGGGGGNVNYLIGPGIK